MAFSISRAIMRVPVSGALSRGATFSTTAFVRLSHQGFLCFSFGEAVTLSQGLYELIEFLPGSFLPVTSLISTVFS